RAGWVVSPPPVTSTLPPCRSTPAGTVRPLARLPASLHVPVPGLAYVPLSGGFEGVGSSWPPHAESAATRLTTPTIHIVRIITTIAFRIPGSCINSACRWQHACQDDDRHDQREFSAALRSRERGFSLSSAFSEIAPPSRVQAAEVLRRERRGRSGTETR